jgi:hypothetical protein
MPDLRLRGDIPSWTIHAEAAEQEVHEAPNLPIRKVFHPPVGAATITPVCS